MDLFIGLPFIMIYILSSIFYNTQALTVGTLMMFLQLLNKITVPFTRFNHVLIKYKQAKISVDRLNETLDVSCEDAEENLLLEEEVKSIRFNNVSFKYKDKNVLDNLSLNIKAGKYR